MSSWTWLLLSLSWVTTWTPWVLRLPFRYPWIIEGSLQRSTTVAIGCVVWIMLVPIGTVWMLQPTG